MITITNSYQLAANMNTDTNQCKVYLCQVGPHVSCGACCGLYNVQDPSQEALTAMLSRRTKWFSLVPRTIAGIDEFKALVETTEPTARPFPDFHHCPFLGLIEDTGKRVGCLLHPSAKGNGGVDWRGLSYYGGMACRTYFCPSAKKLPSHWLSIIHRSVNHWHLHGLIVTERRLLTAFFQELEGRIGRTVGDDDFLPDSDAARLFSGFADLKRTWAFRRDDAPGMCNYFFEDDQYPRPPVIGMPENWPPGPMETIFRELDSYFPSETAANDARRQIEGLFADIVKQLSG